jgi:hypothetical protein
MKYYSLNEDFSSVESRLRGNDLAADYMKIAQRVVFFISQFPFVRGIMISGSLSKNFASPQSDIDFFIITAPNRLWVARLFFVLTQKLILRNNPKYLCFNYMIDANHLELNDKSQFVALEAVTLIPVYGGAYYQSLLQKNKWIRDYYPNYPENDISSISSKNYWHKRGLEWLFNGNLGEWLDKYLMDKTEKRWRKRNDSSFFDKTGKNLVIERYIAKAHTERNYGKIMERYEQKITEFENKVIQKNV